MYIMISVYKNLFMVGKALVTTSVFFVRDQSVSAFAKFPEKLCANQGLRHELIDP